MKDGHIDGLIAEHVETVAEPTEDKKPQEEYKQVTRQELIEQLEHQVNYFDTLPQHEKFSFAINADVYYFMLIILNILKKEG